MSESNHGVLPSLRALRSAWLAWLAAAALLLPLFSLLILRGAATERSVACFSSALSFLASCAAGTRAGRERPGGALLSGLLCAAAIVLPLLACGFLLDRSRLAAAPVLSLVSMSAAGALFGSVFLSGRAGKRARRRPHGFSRRAGRGR